jgi:Protein kinase domain/7TM diverse intracellular signalling/HAMP domain
MLRATLPGVLAALIMIVAPGWAFAQPPRVAAARVYDGAWEYRWGDSPRGEGGELLWAQAAGSDAGAASSSGWEPLAGRAPPNRDGRRYLWLRTRLAGEAWSDPALYLAAIDQIVEAYLDGALVYRFGAFEGPDALRFAGYQAHFVPLGEDYRGKTLALRVYSDHVNIGIFAEPLIGSRAELIGAMIKADLGKLGVGLILVSLGAVVLALFLLRREDKAYRDYSGFTLSVGLYFIAQPPSRSLLVDAPRAWVHVEITLLFLMPIFFAGYFEQIFGSGWLRLVPLARRIHVVYAAGAAALVALGVLPVMATLLPFQVFLLLEFTYLAVMAARSAWSANIDARIFTAGFVFAAVSGVHDVLTAMGVIPRTSLTVGHFGNLIFVLSLGLILGRRFLLMTTRAVRLEVQSAIQSARLAQQGTVLAAAARMAAGDLESPIDIDPGSELSHLGRALDAMRGDVRAKIRMLEARNTEVQVLNEELRRQIEQRSRSLLAALLSDGESRSPDLAPGDMLGERYRVTKLLGRGAMGVVYEVERTSDRRHLAAKVLTGRTDKTGVARFVREAQILAKLDHPNLISIADVDATSEGMLFLVMALVTGSTLVRFKDRRGDILWVLSILRQIAEALRVVHEHGIVHRDLKPGNVLVEDPIANEPPLVKLADFGISILVAGDDQAMLARARASRPEDDDADDVLQEAPTVPNPRAKGSDRQASARADGAGDDLTRTGILVGTPNYMAPELCKGSRHAQPSSDVFSLGVIAYEMITGKMPFLSPPVFMAVAGEPLPTPRLLRRRDDLDPVLTEMFERCISPDPSRRPTARAVAEMLADFGIATPAR